MPLFQPLDPSDKQDFSTLSSFPGEEGNPFDKILRFLEKINQLHNFIYISLLLLLTGILTFFHLDNWKILTIFSLTDLIIISLLPFLKISFGNVKSQAILLAILRAIFIWFSSPINLIFQIIGTFLVIYGFIYEPSSIEKKIILRKLGVGNRIIRFLQFSDIHLEELSVRELKIKRIIENNPPDFILYTGDFLNLSNNKDPKSIQQVVDFFNQQNSIAPVFYVSGSQAVDLDETIEMIQNQISATRLNNTNHIIRIHEAAINLIGITCTHKPHLDILNLENLLEESCLNILLYHSPDLIYELNKENKISLMISGHTHGGQVRLPIFGALFTGSLYGRKLQSGLYQIHDTLLYISRGIGLEGLGAPRVRFLCKPEIIEWNIEI